MDGLNRVGNLEEASKRFGTSENIVDADVGNGTVKKQRSPSRDLRRVRQGLDLVRALFEQFLSSKYVTSKPFHLPLQGIPVSSLNVCLLLEFTFFCWCRDSSLRSAASTAYAQVCAPYHTWAVSTAVSAGMHTLPSREQLLLKLNETDHSAKKKMRRYIKASRPLIDYIDKLYISRKISLDW